MWKGYERLLEHYMNWCIIELVKRGYKNTMLICTHYDTQKTLFHIRKYKYPSWWGSKIHNTHRAALLAKDYDYYSQFGWTEKPEINYYWPI